MLGPYRAPSLSSIASGNKLNRPVVLGAAARKPLFTPSTPQTFTTTPPHRPLIPSPWQPKCRSPAGFRTSLLSRHSRHHCVVQPLKDTSFFFFKICWGLAHHTWVEVKGQLAGIRTSPPTIQGSRDQTQVVRLSGSRNLLWLSHLTDSHPTPT